MKSLMFTGLVVMAGSYLAWQQPGVQKFVERWLPAHSATHIMAQVTQWQAQQREQQHQLEVLRADIDALRAQLAAQATIAAAPKVIDAPPVLRSPMPSETLVAELPTNTSQHTQQRKLQDIAQRMHTLAVTPHGR